MSYIYEPEVEEEDEGYSIPKILVAVLLLVLVVAGVFIINQNRELKSLFNKFESQKKSIENQLDEMILKYNLAIDDNGSLTDELQAERDKVIRFRDSVKKIREADFKNIEEYNKAIKTLKENSAIVFDDVKKNPPTEQAKETEKKEEPVVAKETTEKAVTTTAAKQETQENTTTKTVATTPVGPQSFERVEVPPTYPGCTGDVAQKKACFNQNVKAVLAKKFDTTLASDLGLTAGKQRIMVGFTVDKFGNVSNIQARGPHPKLEAEAIKAAKALPKMTAARQNGVPVDVSYNVPITFIVQ